MQWSDLMSRPRPQASERIAYGADPNQFGDLWRPEGSGLHPLVVMIHGGCWEAATADLHIMDWAADDLRRRGYVVWNIEYRRIDQPGGGYPGTYEDVSTALAAVRGTGAARFGADLSRKVILGHSAGGHLALWAGHRAGARLKGVVAIGAITDLEGDTNTGCGVEGLPKMTGPQTADRPDVYADTSPYHMAAPLHPVVLVTGSEDVTVPPSIARRYAARMAYGEHWSLTGLPPALVVTAGFDPLKDEGMDYARALEGAGVKAQHMDFPTLIHDFYLLADVSPTVKEAINQTADALKAGLA
ncbi:MAG: alpha/beta hydrolase [Pseudomonadota bacterium]|nr:alpha/beta hydrolase [Pseudomonadota bacterium]